MTRSDKAWPWWRWALTGLSSVALALSAYLAWHYLVGEAVFGCGGPGPAGCEQVLQSRWSTVGGVLPVSGLAAGTYLAMLLASLSIGPAAEPPVRRLAWGAMLVLVGAAAGSAVWFTLLQKWVMGIFCPYCTATHITGLLLAALVIWQAPRQFEGASTEVQRTPQPLEPRLGSAVKVNPGSRAARSGISPLPATTLAFVGLGLAAVLAACQAGFAPPLAYHGGDSRNKLPVIDPHAAPLIGSPEAAYIINLLFDYKCPHCQQLHFLLHEAIRQYGGKLAFALCPTPLNRQCNPYISRDEDEFKDSCELAKVGLAVWVANREAFAAFDDWMFSFESGDRWHPRSLDAARAKAVELVGRAKFDSARADDRINQYLQTCIRIYAATMPSGNGAIPKLVFGSRWAVPEPRDANDLVLILQNSLAVPRP